MICYCALTPMFSRGQRERMGKNFYNLDFPPSDIEVSHFKGSGPGGQNRNKRMTGVRVVHLPTGIVATATERRSQAQNLDAALSRLRDKIRAHFFRPTPRVATKKSRGSNEKRLTHKKTDSKKKQSRKKYRFDD